MLIPYLPYYGAQRAKPTGELLIVHITLVGLGIKHIRIANLPPEVSSDTLQAALAPYGKIMEIQNVWWSKIYRYPVDNSIQQVTMVLSRHVPSHLTVANQRVLLSYKGQPPTCYGCGESGHMYQRCPARHKMGTKRTFVMAATYASIVTASAATKEGPLHGIATASGTVED